MATVGVKLNMPAARLIAGGMGELAKNQLKFALAKTLTDLAIDAASVMTESLDASFDKPTPFTKKAFAIKSARKNNLRADVFAKKTQAAYLVMTETGERRKPGMPGTGKRAIIAPAGIRLNSYGNIPKGQVRKLLAKPDVFSGTITFHKTGQTISGIWQRPKKGIRRDGTKGTIGRVRDHTQKAWGNTQAVTGLKLLVRYDEEQEVKPRLHFEKTVQARVSGRFLNTFEGNMRLALRTAHLKK